jgi:transposase
LSQGLTLQQTVDEFMVAKQGLCLYYLPPYSPELKRIEILWKHAKYFWRRFAGINGTDLLYEIEFLMKGFGSEFTINFA